jgi:Xaa-Pro aminopeptidase
MQLQEVDYVFLTPDSEMYYLSGFEKELHDRPFFLVIPRDGEPFFFVPDVYREELENCTPLKNFEVWTPSEDPEKKLSQLFGSNGAERVLFSEKMDAKFAVDIIDIFPEAEYGLADEILEELRLTKDENEIRKIRESSGIADEVIKELRDMGRQVIGMTEDELAELINQKMFEKGGAKTPFNTVASSGPNGSKPHYEHGEKVIEEGEPVVLDFGCYKDHYPSDQTRTIVFGGEPSGKFKEVHDIVRKAQQKAVEKVESGVKAKEVDTAARKVIEEAGYGEEFIHRTGHGVGLDIHEPPFINQQNDRVLEKGMVFSVEPGIYIEGEFGVRIEDLVYVTEDGCERLNKTDRGWR